MGGSPARFRAPQALPINAGLSRRRSSHARVRARPGAYARLPAWWGREHWLEEVVPAALTRRRLLERHHPVAPDTARMIARELAAAADHRTGRQARPTIEAVAAAAGVCERTVQRAVKLLEALGVVVRVVEGRSAMTRAERLWAWRNGSSARALAAEFALVVPAAVAKVVHSLRRAAVERVTPPALGEREQVKSPDLSSHHEPNKLDRSRASPGTHKKRREPVLTPATIRHRRLVAGLQKRIGWLSAASPRRLTSLHRFAAQGWTARDVHQALDELLRARRWSVPERVENPPAYLAMLLRCLEPTDSIRDSRNDEQAAARAAWQAALVAGAECPHGQPGGAIPHPVDGYKACPLCRREEAS